MKKHFRRVLAASPLLAVIGAANAAVPAGVTTAIQDIGTDGAAVATTVLLAIVAIFAVKFLRRGL